MIGALSVKITADTKGVQDGIKASGKALEIGSKQLRESANRWGKWALAATSAAAGVAAAIIKSNLSAIRELKNVAAAADTQVAAFQRGAFAAEQFGISTEKYGDVLKDVQDRIGDFMIAGSGPLVDFFEVIAPKVGITADAFKNLSGQESLGLFVKTLDEAGVSQAEMAFFMEALAGDAIRLAPLFENNAEAFNALTKEAEALGIGLSDIDVAKAELASAELAKAAGIIDAMTKQATTDLAPIIAAITDLFVDMAKEAGGASEFIKDGLDGVVNVVGIFADGLKGVEIIFKGLELAAVGFSALVANVFAGIVNVQTKFVDFFIGTINTIIKASNKFLGTDFGVIPALKDSDFVKSINKVADEMTGLVKETTEELDKLLLEPLPSGEIKTFVEQSVKEYEKLATARAKALGQTEDGEGVGTKKTSEIEVLEAETIGILEALGLRFQSQEEMQLAHLQREREMTNQAFANGELTAIQNSEKLAEIKQQEEDLKRNITMMGIQQGFQVLASGSKKIQKLMAAAATVQAVIKGKQAAVDAWQAGMSVGGPFAPVVAAAYAAASLAQTGSIIKSIQSGGKSQGSIGGGGFSTSAGGGQAAPQQQAQQQQAQQPRVVEARFVGEGSMSMTGVRNLIEQFNEAIGDGAELRVTTG